MKNGSSNLKQIKKSELYGINYEIYIFTASETLLYISQGLFLAGVIAYIFYRSVLVFLLFIPLLPIFLKSKKTDLCRKRKQELNSEFKESIQAVAASLRAGYSVENAFTEAYKDMVLLYGEQGYITKEYAFINRMLNNNVTLEQVLSEFSNRSGIEDIKEFADVLATAKRTGGDLISIIQNAVDTISKKAEIKREIETMISAKQLEQKIMNVIPFAIIFYVGSSSPGFLDVLYGNVAGACIMSGGLLIYLVAFYLAKKIVSIEI